MGDWLGADTVTPLAELADDRAFLADLEAAVANVDDFQEKKWASLLAFNTFRVGLYVLSRVLKPTAVVETGVLHGMSSAFVLHALVKNDFGRLISIDLPATKTTGPNNIEGFRALLPDGRQPGWIVPERHRCRWELRLGDSLNVLPEALNGLSPGMFIHDSRHSYEVMSAEYALAWDALHRGGVLISDNIECDTAFFDFCRCVQRAPFAMPDIRPTGALRQPKLRYGMVAK